MWADGIATNEIILFRIGERLTLTVAILIIALVVMVGFWRTVQKLDLSDGSKLGVGGSFAFSTPVFVLLAIIGYAWVSLEHPIQVSPAAAPDESAAVETDQSVSAAPAVASNFLGSASLQPVADAPTEDLDPVDAAVLRRRLRTLNCLIADADSLSLRAQIDLTDIKLMLVAPLWDPSWGAWGDFKDWAQGRNLEEPHEDALSTWTTVHAQC